MAINAGEMPWRLGGGGVLMCAIRSAVRASGIFARVKRLFNRFPPFLISENGKRARRTGQRSCCGSFVSKGSLSLLMGLGLKITIDFRGLREEGRGRRRSSSLNGFLSLILSQTHSSQKSSLSEKETHGGKVEKDMSQSRTLSFSDSLLFSVARPSSRRWKRPTCQHNSRPFSS